MDKVLVEIYVPASELTFDVFMSLESPMYEVLELVKKAAVEMSEDRYTASESTVICYREDGTILNINLSVYELGICNGSKLMLI